MYSTNNFKSKEDKKKEQRTIHISDTSLNKGLVSCKTQLYAKSIAGVHNSQNSQKRTTKGKNLNNASRKAAKVLLRKQNWD